MSERLNSKSVQILFAAVMFIMGVIILIQASWRLNLRAS
jgi:hypothetical protein